MIEVIGLEAVYTTVVDHSKAPPDIVLQHHSVSSQARLGRCKVRIRPLFRIEAEHLNFRLS
jgi:3-dehydroquinate synthase class II